MEKTPGGWTIIDREAGVLTIEYAFTEGGATANCFVVRMGNGKLMVISPSKQASDQVFDELTEFGEVGALVANNGFHHMGLETWLERFPDAGVYASPKAAARIAKKNQDAPTPEPLAGLVEQLGESVHVTELPNTKCGETWAWAEIAGGTAWYVSDVLINLEELRGPFLQRMMFKLTKSAPGYRVFNLMLKFTVKDKQAALQQLAKEMKEHPPTVIVPAHGTLLDQPDLAERTRALLEPFL